MNVGEILANWDGNHEYDDWYAIDMCKRGKIRRVAVGPGDDIKRRAELFVTGANMVQGDEPCEPGEFGLPEDVPFWRVLLIPSSEAKEHFDAIWSGVEAVSNSEAAEMLEVSRGRVSQLISAGILETDDEGWVTVESIERRIASNPKAGRPRKAVEEGFCAAI